MKTEITSLREGTKNDMRSPQEEVSGECGQIRTAQVEFNDKYKEMGQSLGEMIAIEKTQQTLTKMYLETPRQAWTSKIVAGGKT